jgi:hypothetical protein
VTKQSVVLQQSVTLSGDLHLTNASTFTVGSTAVIDGDLVIDAATTVLFSGDVIVGGNLTITQASSVTFAGTLMVGGTLTIGDVSGVTRFTGDVSVGAATVTSTTNIQVQSGFFASTGDVTFTSNRINFSTAMIGGTTDSTLTIQPRDSARSIAVGSPPGIATGLAITDADLNAIQSGWKRVVLGDEMAGTGAVRVGSIGSQYGGYSQVLNTTTIVGGSIIVEQAVDAHREEQIVRPAQLVEFTGERRHGRDVLDLAAMLRLEVGQGREGHGRRVSRCSDAAIGMGLIEFSVEDDHLAVEPLERAEPEIAVRPEASHRDRFIVDPLHQRARGRDLEERRMVEAQRFGQRPRHEMAQGFAGLLAVRQKRIHERLIDFGSQPRHCAILPSRATRAARPGMIARTRPGIESGATR